MASAHQRGVVPPSGPREDLYRTRSFSIADSGACSTDSLPDQLPHAAPQLEQLSCSYTLFSRGRMGKTRSIERRWQPDWAPCLLRSLDSLEVLMVRNVVLGHLRTLYR